MRLFRSEFLRARSRRLVPMVVVGGLLAVADQPGDRGVLLPQAVVSRRRDQAQAAFDSALRERANGRSAAPGTRAALPGTTRRQTFCEHNSGPLDQDGFLLRDLDTILQHIATFVILLGALLGASLGGADWTNNTMQTLLTWEPRRIRVLSRARGS